MESESARQICCVFRRFYLHVSPRLEPVELVQQLQHRALNLALSSRSCVIPAQQKAQRQPSGFLCLFEAKRLAISAEPLFLCDGSLLSRAEAYLFVPTASISSMKTMEGACSRATLKSSRTSFGPSPKYF